jgi:hypothetical protein
VSSVEEVLKKGDDVSWEAGAVSVQISTHKDRQPFEVESDPEREVIADVEGLVMREHRDAGNRRGKWRGHENVIRHRTFGDAVIGAVLVAVEKGGKAA